MHVNTRYINSTRGSSSSICRPFRENLVFLKHWCCVITVILLLGEMLHSYDIYCSTVTVLQNVAATVTSFGEILCSYNLKHIQFNSVTVLNTVATTEYCYWLWYKSFVPKHMQLNIDIVLNTVVVTVTQLWGNLLFLNTSSWTLTLC